MTEQHTYPLELLRAELKSAMAEQLVQLMDRFASKRDLADFRTDFLAHTKDDDDRFAAIDHKLDLLLAEKDGRDAVKAEQAARTAQWWVALGIFATILVGALTVGATLLARAIWG